MTHDANFGIYFWAVLLLYGGVMYAMTPSSVSIASFFRGTDNTELVSFLIGKYGRAAAMAFTVAILIRPYNEVWSNTAVVGGYFGPPGSAAFIGSALLLGTNRYGLILCFSGFLLPLWLGKHEAAPA